MIERAITKKLSEMLEKFPVALLTGARQSGKSTLLRNAFPTIAPNFIKKRMIIAPNNQKKRIFAQ